VHGNECGFVRVLSKNGEQPSRLFRSSGFQPE
jgi:hypothetical protein